jgi:hypothetical protein
MGARKSKALQALAEVPRGERSKLVVSLDRTGVTLRPWTRGRRGAWAAGRGVTLKLDEAETIALAIEAAAVVGAALRRRRQP